MQQNGISTAPSLIEMLRKLIAAPSVSSANPELDQSNRPVIDLLANWLDALGFSVEILPVPEQKGKFNLLACLGNSSPTDDSASRGGLVLSGHTDTVPYDASLWKSDPFELSERNGKLFGLGSTDMKGFFACAIEAMRDLRAEQLQQPLFLLATADEESSMSGARALIDHHHLSASYAIIGEPTGLVPVHMHKGVMMESLRIVGQSGHSSNPALGANALDAMQRAISELMRLREEWAKKFYDPGFDIAAPTLNLAAIHGGDAPNRICGHCQLAFDIRLTPGMRSDEVREILCNRVNLAIEGMGVTATMAPLFDGVEPFLQARDSDIIQSAEQLTEHRARSVNFATEAPFLQRMGMQTVVLGPGSIDCAHQANEYIEQNQMSAAVNLLKSLIQRYCRAPAH